MYKIRSEGLFFSDKIFQAIFCTFGVTLHDHAEKIIFTFNIITAVYQVICNSSKSC